MFGAQQGTYNKLLKGREGVAMSAMLVNCVRRLLLLFVDCCDVGFWLDRGEFGRLTCCCCDDRCAVG